MYLLEVLINQRTDLLSAMFNSGIFRALETIIVDENDPLVLVCVISCYVIYMLFFCVQKASVLLSSALIDHYGLETKDRKQLCQGIIMNVMKLFMV